MTTLTVMVFQGVQNLPLFAAEHRGFFAARGLSVDRRIAPNSVELREGLAQGRYQIVHTSVDNAVAMAEHAKVDVAVVLGGDNGWNDFYVQPEIESYADLRGRTLIVDAVDTAFAFQLYQMMSLNGVKLDEVHIKPVGATRFRLKAMTADNSFAGCMLNLPFSLLAARAGIKKFATATDVIGAYQSTGGFALRTWAGANRDVLVNYLAAYIEGLRWVLDPANKAAVIALLEQHLDIPHDIATQSYAVATDPTNGFAKDAKIDHEGFANVLALRAAQHGDWDGKPPQPERYLDLSYYDAALKTL